MGKYFIEKKSFSGEEGVYTAFGITAETETLSVTVHDISTEQSKVLIYIDQLIRYDIPPEKLLDTISGYIDRSPDEASLV